MSCLICESNANGQHFGIRCCRACAAFFRRTLNMNLRYKCRFEKKCEVSLNKRYSCRFCRFEKCVRVGMRKDMVQGKPESGDVSGGETEDSVGRSPQSSVDSTSSTSAPYEPNWTLPLATSAPIVPTTTTITNEYQHNIIFHHSVIEEVGKAVLPNQIARGDYAHIDYLNLMNEQGTSNCQNIFALAAAQATQDLHVNVQNILAPSIDSMFDKPPEAFATYPSIPLTMCQQALLAYQEHNRQWPDQDKLQLVENRSLDMDLFMRNHYREIEHIAKFCMSIRTFALLPKDQKWILFKHFWTRFYELDRSYATCQRLGYNLDDDRCVTFSGQIINFGISVVKLELISDMDANQVKEFLKGSIDKFRVIFVNPFKKLRPTEYELMYMMMSIMWSVTNLIGVTEATKQIAEKVEMRLAEDLHNYYAESLDNSKPNYAGRITRLSSIASAVDEITERKREDSQVSKTFNIFKNDFFLGDFTL